MAPIESLSVTVCHRRLGALPERDAVCVVVGLRGEHDLSTVPVLSEAMAWVIAVDDAEVVVDLSEVEFMCAATVGVFLRARELLRARSRTLVVRSPSEWAQFVLELCCATDLLDRAESGTLMRAAGALATRVPVRMPPTGHFDGHADAAPPEPARAPAPGSVGQLPAASVPWCSLADRAYARAADVTGVGAL
jgi:anti-anti-sigma factor